MAQSFIGKPISLISHSDVRYRGILAGIDPAASTIQLSNVFSMGTESRRPPSEFIAPVQEPYQYIIFRASEVKDLAVDETTPRRSVHDDPAVLAVPPASVHASPYPTPAQAVPGHIPPQHQPPHQPQPPQHQPPPPSQNYPMNATVPIPQQQQPHPPASNAQPTATAPRTANPNSGRRNNNSVHTAAASLETVERALGDLRVSNAANAAVNGTTITGGSSGGRGGRRGGRNRADGASQQPQQLKVPTTDFDFESSNARFDKAALSARGSEEKGSEKGEENDGNAEESTSDKKETAAYNPQKSFFDSLSPGAPPERTGNANGGGGRGRRGGRGGGGRNRREEEREKNVATFGEPGGVGLMGPGAYVGGWGASGRRGGRPRRGGGPPAAQSTGVPARG